MTITTLPNDCLLLATSFVGNNSLTQTCGPLRTLKTEGDEELWDSIRERLGSDPFLASYVKSLSLWSTIPEKMKEIQVRMGADLRAINPRMYLTLNAVNRGTIHPFELAEQLKDASLKKAWVVMRKAIVKANVMNVPSENASVGAIRGWFSSDPDLSAITQLDLSNLKLFVIPKEIRKFTGLKGLNLSRNCIRNVDKDAFCGLSELNILDLSKNQIVEIPKGAFQGLTELENLYLEKNQLQMICVGAFDNLPHLKALALQENRLRVLPAEMLKGCPALEGIDLGDNKLVCLPDTIFQGHDHLWEIRLSNNALQRIHPNTFQGLPRLNRLMLSGNSIYFLPKTVFHNLPRLKNLYLYCNQLHTLDFDLPLPALTILDLSHNHFKTLPDRPFRFLPRLIKLCLESNQLQNLPNALIQGLTRLKELQLENNRLQDLPLNFFDNLHVREVNLDDNPTDFTRIQSALLNGPLSKWDKASLLAGRVKRALYNPKVVVPALLAIGFTVYSLYTATPFPLERQTVVPYHDPFLEWGWTFLSE